jgi:RNA polymerase sigma factor (sigma-70 family)
MAATTATEVATASAPHESLDPRGRSGARPGDGAAAARTAELFAQYGRTVSGLCKALLRDRAEAEDAAQQTFLSAHRALLNGTDPREPAAWLATIARNECWRRIRARMREPLPTGELEAVATSGDPYAEAIRRADLAALWEAIERLPRQQRDALVLREFGGLTYDELAAALAVTSPAIESLLFRARTRLRTQLRTAYASVTGASWIEALARVFVGGGVPVAAKVAALGVGAAAVTSGAVVAPQLLESRHGRAPAPVRPAQTVGRHVGRTAPAPPTVAPVERQAVSVPTVERTRAVVAAPAAHARSSGRSGTHEREAPELETHPAARTATTEAEHSSGERQKAEDSAGGRAGSGGEGSSRDGSGRDGTGRDGESRHGSSGAGSTGSDGGRSGGGGSGRDSSGRDPGGDSGEGGDGSHGGDGGGQGDRGSTAPAATDPAATVPAPLPSPPGEGDRHPQSTT